MLKKIILPCLMVIFVVTLTSGCASNQPSSQATVSETDISTKNQPERSIDVIPTKPESIVSISPIATPDTIWPRLTNPFYLAEANYHKNIDPHLNWFKNNQSYIDRITGRGNFYLFYILEEVETRGLPHELALLPAIESAFNPKAYSHSHAAGLWQFIPTTGQRFGLERTWWADERRDVIDSTHAALDYLEYLHKLFDNDWLLAIAAYNCGEGTVGRAIRKNKKKGLPTDFWSLKLPKETRGYVPRLLALSKVIQQPQQYGLQLQDIANQPYFDVVSLPDQIDLIIAAQMAGIKFDTLKALNPALKRRVTAPNGPHRILLPTVSTQQFKTALATMPQSQWKPMEQYIVKPGDSLYKIAKAYHLGINELTQYNKLSSNVLQIGQRIEIPGSGINSAMANSEVLYTIKLGDSLWGIARKYGSTVKDLTLMNNLASNSIIKPGQQLTINSIRSTAESRLKKLIYKVRRGDSLSRIASNFYLSIADILSWNQINQKKYLQPGQRLTLFVDLNKI